MIIFQLLYTFFLIGLFSFGGGMSMMAMIEQEVVGNHHWMEASKLYQFIGIAEATPGPIAVNIATFIGSEKGGFLGALVSTFAVITPAFIIIIIVAGLFTKFAQSKVVQSILNGIKPIVLGLLFAMALKITFINLFKTFQFNVPLEFSYQPLLIILIISLTYFICLKLLKKKIPPIGIILYAMGLGILVYL